MTSGSSDDLTLRDLYLSLRVGWQEAVRHWWLYAIMFVLLGGYFTYRAWSQPVTYPARLTFMVNEEEGPSLGGVSGMLGQLGLVRRVGGRLNMDKIIELARSRKIIQNVLLSPISDDNSGQFIANQLITEYGLDAKWAEADSSFTGFRFTHDSVAAFSPNERSALLRLHGLVVGGEKQKGLVAAGYDENSGILHLTCETTSEDLSIGLARTHFAELSRFYINQAIERQQKTYNLVRAKVDSIAAELSRADVELAVFTDASRNMFARVDQVKGARLQREIAKLAAMQAEAVKNSEFAEFNLKNARPVIQDLDLPISPLTPVKASLTKALLTGMAIAFVLVSVYLFFRKLARDVSRHPEH